MKIKRFNESNQYLIKDDEILEFLQDGFIDNDILVEVKRFPTESSSEIYTIDERQLIILNIGNPERSRKKSDYFTLKDKFDDLKRLVNWFETQDVIFQEMIFLTLLNVETDSIVDENFSFYDINEYDPNKNLFLKDSIEKYGFVQLIFENYDWQNYNNEIIQEYTFKDMNHITNFISECMKIFEKNNHHPNYLHWNENKVIISLRTHSSNSVTEKDWTVANQIDLIYEN
jgi:4a-hydroxytetrahydrobiopterin dehydratase